MSRRSKREARTALSALGEYLRRDPHALQLVNAVERYVGELRQEQAELKDQVASSENLAISVQEAVAGAEEETAAVATRLESERGSHRQTRILLTRATQRVKALEDDVANLRERLERLASQVADPPVDLKTKGPEIEALFQKLRHRMSHAPVPARLIGKMTVIDTRRLVTTFEREEYETIGMLAAFCSFANLPIGFEVEEKRTFRGRLGADESREDRLSKWLWDTWLVPVHESENKRSAETVKIMLRTEQSDRKLERGEHADRGRHA